VINVKNTSINDFHYELPEDRIALRPLDQRDASKLLVYNNEKIEESIFSDVTTFLPENALLVFNNSKVIHARLRFPKKTGSLIEVFCLEPSGDITDYVRIMEQTETSQWKCMIGGVAKWKEPYLDVEANNQGETVTLRATLISKATDDNLIQFEWWPKEKTLAEILLIFGDVPLPPYIKRKTDVQDPERYQTIYAKEEGSVAAPTAGLHFSDAVFERMKIKKIEKAFVSLHVGAGTFKPVKADRMEDHDMHSEWISVEKETIQKLIEQQGEIVAVGTTSLRTLESLYWLGVHVANNPSVNNPVIQQWDVYDSGMQNTTLTKVEALTHLLHWLNQKGKSKLFTQTQLLIAPGYLFRVADHLITNFHQPKSTLLLLVAAAIGEDWKKCYDYAINRDFRFLSYGDANLIKIKNKF
jgi:S-adenosylmethionine:tRNA ribosyltransferase-isomerase